MITGERSPGKGAEREHGGRGSDRGDSFLHLFPPRTCMGLREQRGDLQEGNASAPDPDTGRAIRSSSSEESFSDDWRGCGRSTNVTASRSIRLPSTSSTSKRSPSYANVVAGLWRAPELAEDEACDGVEVLVRQVGAEPLVELVDREACRRGARCRRPPVRWLARGRRTRPRSRRRSPRSGPRACRCPRARRTRRRRSRSGCSSGGTPAGATQDPSSPARRTPGGAAPRAARLRSPRSWMAEKRSRTWRTPTTSSSVSR